MGGEARRHQGGIIPSISFTMPMARSILFRISRQVYQLFDLAGRDSTQQMLLCHVSQQLYQGVFRGFRGVLDCAENAATVLSSLSIGLAGIASGVLLGLQASIADVSVEIDEGRKQDHALAHGRDGHREKISPCLLSSC